MASQPHIDLSLPPDLYARIQDAAAVSGRPLESVLVESLDLLFGATVVDWDNLAAAIEVLPDAQLWALVYRRMPWPDRLRLRGLTAQSQATRLASDEQEELAALIDDADRFMVLRSRALSVLQSRGQRILEFIDPEQDESSATAN